LIGYRGEFQPQAITWAEMPHDSLGSDVSLLNKKFELGFHALGLADRRGEEQPTHTQIADP
jgi:hypothetical protein